MLLSVWACFLAWCGLAHIMTYSRNFILSLRYTDAAIDERTRRTIEQFDIFHTDRIVQSIPTIWGRRPLSARPTQHGKHLDKLVNIQCKPSSSIFDKQINVASINCRSVRNKANSIADYVIDKDVDICGLTETWLYSGDADQKTLGDLTPNGYRIRHVPRLGKKGGGVAVLYRKTLRLNFVNNRFSSFECMQANFTTSGSHCILLVVYRLIPRQSVNGVTSDLFFTEFTDLLDKLCLQC